MKRFAIVAAMFAAACGYSEDKFADEAAEAGCALAVNCFEAYDDVAACLADNDDTTEEGDCLNYDSAAAQDCVDGYQALADNCPTDMTDPTAFVVEACADVCDVEADTGMDTEADSDSDTAAM